MDRITRVGIDVSKDRLDVYIERDHNCRLEFPNDGPGVQRLVRELAGSPCIVAMEASGRYEGAARHALEAAGLAVVLQNPRQVRRLAQGLGLDAKTDRLDARLLARTSDLCAPNNPRSVDRERLGDLSRLIERLKLERSGHLKRLQVPGLYKAAAESLGRIVLALEAEIRALCAEFDRTVAGTDLGPAYRLAQSVPGVGPNLARVAVCELPQDLGRWSVRQVSRYAGVAPLDNSSGSRTSPSRLPRHKNVRLKAALYMPALSLVKSGGWARKVYDAQRAKGLTHQQAVVPIMHKLLFHIVAVMKRGTPWMEEPPVRP